MSCRHRTASIRLALLATAPLLGACSEDDSLGFATTVGSAGDGLTVASVVPGTAFLEGGSSEPLLSIAVLQPADGEPLRVNAAVALDDASRRGVLSITVDGVVHEVTTTPEGEVVGDLDGIAQHVTRDRWFLVLADEPTGSLDDDEVERFWKAVAAWRARGDAVPERTPADVLRECLAD
ncbi:MAG: hypothetical protein R3F34_18005 [Planctomycetota bacterium]